jgi:hypothetical protein
MNRIEPPADLRNAAIAQYQMYIAYIDAGFTEKQALSLIRAIIKGQS